MVSSATSATKYLRIAVITDGKTKLVKPAATGKPSVRICADAAELILQNTNSNIKWLMYIREYNVSLHV